MGPVGRSEFWMALLIEPKIAQTERGGFPHQHLAPAFQHLRSPCFQQITFLCVQGCRLDAVSLGHLTAVPWPFLSRLDASTNGLNHTAMAQLAEGAWPLLKELVLSSNNIDIAAVTELVHGDWPLLCNLHLSDNPISQPAAYGLLTSANWRHVQNLQLFKVQLNPACLQSLFQVNWPLWSLDLREASLDASAVLVLAQAQLPELVQLMLCDN